MTESLNICPICLRTNRKLKTIASVLSVYHDELTEYSFWNNKYKYCGDCEWLLRKTYNFHQKCSSAAKILTKWRNTAKNKTSANQLYLKLPPMSLDMWTPENSKVYTYDCSEEHTPTLVIDGTIEKPHLDTDEKVNMAEDIIYSVKEEDIENVIHSEDLFQMEIHCEDEQITGVSETRVQNIYNESQDSRNVFQNKLTNDNTIDNAGPSGSNDMKINKIETTENVTNNVKKHVVNRNSNVSKVNVQSNKRRSCFRYTDGMAKTTHKIKKTTHNEAKAINKTPKLTNDVSKFKIKDIVQTPTNDVPITIDDEPINKKECQQSTSNVPKLTNDMLESTHDISKHIDDMPILKDEVTNDSQNQSSIVNASEDLDVEVICLEQDNNSKDDVIVIDDDIEYPDDASLNSADDCDDYLHSPPKKSKVKMTLDQLANIELSDDDFDDDDEPDTIIPETKSGSTKSSDKSIPTEKNIITKLKIMTETLDSICKNWEITSLIDVGIPNLPKDEVKKLIRQHLTGLTDNADNEIKSLLGNRLKHLKKVGAKNKLSHISSDLDLINKQCKQLVDDYKNGLVSPTQRLKTELLQRFEALGELKSEKGYVFDKDILMDCLDTVSERAAGQLLYYLQGTNKLSPAAVKQLKYIQSKHDHEQYKSVFNIEYMTTEREILEEFEKRKTYECYLKAEFKCDICYQGFKHERSLEYHKKCHDKSQGPFPCPICRKRHRSRRKLNSHMKTHETIYKCKLCPLVTYYKLSMMNHFEQHQGILYKCEPCGAVYKSKSVYLFHQSRSHPRGSHVCTICGGGFISALGLQTHVGRKHRGETPVATGNSLKCKNCELTFRSPEACARHERTSHGIPSPYLRKRTQRRPPLEPRKKPTLTCRVCNAIGHSFGWLSSHFSTDHPTVNREQLYADRYGYLCDICGKGFMTKYNLRDHIAVHMNATVPCPSCPKRFRSQIGLRQHQLTHGPPGFCCERCGKKFHTNSNLYNHTRSHIGDRRFKCSICSKGFLHRCSLQAHIRGVHNHERRVRRRGRGAAPGAAPGASRAVGTGPRDEMDVHGLTDIEAEVVLETADMIINPE